MHFHSWPEESHSYLDLSLVGGVSQRPFSITSRDSAHGVDILQGMPSSNSKVCSFARFDGSQPDIHAMRRVARVMLNGRWLTHPRATNPNRNEIFWP